MYQRLLVTCQKRARNRLEARFRPVGSLLVTGYRQRGDKYPLYKDTKKTDTGNSPFRKPTKIRKKQTPVIPRSANRASPPALRTGKRERFCNLSAIPAQQDNIEPDRTQVLKAGGREYFDVPNHILSSCLCPTTLAIRFQFLKSNQGGEPHKHADNTTNKTGTTDRLPARSVTPIAWMLPGYVSPCPWG